MRISEKAASRSRNSQLRSSTGMSASRAGAWVEAEQPEGDREGEEQASRVRLPEAQEEEAGDGEAQRDRAGEEIEQSIGYSSRSQMKPNSSTPTAASASRARASRKSRSRSTSKSRITTRIVRGQEQEAERAPEQQPRPVRRSCARAATRRRAGQEAEQIDGRRGTSSPSPRSFRSRNASANALTPGLAAATIIRRTAFGAARRKSRRLSADQFGDLLGSRRVTRGAVRIDEDQPGRGQRSRRSG